jgi:poly(3-hydroxybutyrate) depolymerase
MQPTISIFLIVAAGLFNPGLAAPTAGCGKDLPAASPSTCNSTNLTPFTTRDGTKREYRIHVPSKYDKDTAAPLIFSFHGHSKDACKQEKLSQFSNEDWNPDAIAVYPQGLKVRVSLLSTIQKLTIIQGRL